MISPAEQKLRELLAALDQSLATVGACATAARSGISIHSLAPYYDYRASLEEYEAIVLVVRHSLRQQTEATATRAREILLQRERKLLSLTIKAALDFFFALSAKPVLSLGIRECFAQELRSLHNAEQRVGAEQHRGQISPDLETDLMMAREILGEIMEKAPSLLDLG
jgi:hypothetical protein